MYAIATLVDEITFAKNAEDMGYEPYDYDDDGREPLEFTFQNTTFAIKEILFNRDTASFPNGMAVQPDGTLTYETTTETTCCICGREFDAATEIGKEMLLPISSWGGFSGCDTSCLIEDEFCNELAMLLRKGGSTMIGEIDEDENSSNSTEWFVANEIMSMSMPDAFEQEEIEIISIVSMSMPGVELQEEDTSFLEEDLVIDSSSMSMSEIQLPDTFTSMTTSPESTAAPVDVEFMLSTSTPGPEDITTGTTAATIATAPELAVQTVVSTTAAASTAAPETFIGTTTATSTAATELTAVPSDVDTMSLSMPNFLEETTFGATVSDQQSMPMMLEELPDGHYGSMSMSMKAEPVDYIPPIEEPVEESITSNDMNTSSENNSNG
eukprot:scaffold52118_cov74-Cyclotella_meneghiniana.AAC.3